MASHGCSLRRSATCLAGLRRLARSSGNITTPLGPAVSSIAAQTRAKSTHTRPQDRGVLVRLLEDIPKFGRKGAVFRTERGRMRNEWFPTNKAEYVTKLRLQELLMGPGDIGERDRGFVPLPPAPDAVEPVPAPEEAAPMPMAIPAELVPLDYAETRVAIANGIPNTLQFSRIPIQEKQEPKRSISPLVSPRAPNSSDQRSAIFGSVSAHDIVALIKQSFSPPNRPITLGPEHIRFLDLPQGADRIKMTGSYRVEIMGDIPTGENDTTNAAPVVRKIRVVPSQESSEKDGSTA